MIGPIDAVEPHANRAIVFIFEGKNPVRIHGLTADCDDTSCDRMPARYEEIPGTHYDVYSGEGYRAALALEREWLSKHLIGGISDKE